MTFQTVTLDMRTEIKSPGERLVLVGVRTGEHCKHYIPLMIKSVD